MPEKRKLLRRKVEQPASAPKRKNRRRDRPDVPAHIPQPKLDFARQSRILRNQGATDFIVDSEGRSIRWHYERKDRMYSQVIAWRTFEMWSVEDKWTDRRMEFWEQMEQRVIAHYADKLFRDRLQEMGKLEELLETYEPYLKPLRDKNTNEILYREDGLPQFALKLPYMDKFAEMFLKIHERLMLLRGEAISRSDQLDKGRPPVTAHTDDPVVGTVNLSRAQARMMAQVLLREKKDMILPESALETEGVEVDDDKVPEK